MYAVGREELVEAVSAWIDGSERPVRSGGAWRPVPGEGWAEARNASWPAPPARPPWSRMARSTRARASTSRHRQRRRSIIGRYRSNDGKLTVSTLAPRLEKLLSDNVQATKQGLMLVV